MEVEESREKKENPSIWGVLLPVAHTGKTPVQGSTTLERELAQALQSGPMRRHSCLNASGLMCRRLSRGYVCSSGGSPQALSANL